MNARTTTPSAAKVATAPAVHVEGGRKLAVVAVTSAFAAGLGFFAVRSFVRARRHARRHRNWQESDMKLDLTLEEAGNTSDPTAMY
ncbi:MAG TPA: hypothetical protein VKT78_12355 [Fimbriimonadaceae bacterium]|nr:hypothetical protein [Fimbriimonadaceae bacterium]